MKHQSASFNKKSQFIITPTVDEAIDEELPRLEPDEFKTRLGELLQVQNDFFPCFDWVFPPPILTKDGGISDAKALFAAPSVTPGIFSLYIHVPFCKTLCSFCYYRVLPGEKNAKKAGSYVDYLLKEMAMYAEVMKGQICESIYIGGGTPTTLTEPQMRRLFEGIHSMFDVKEGAEISIESAPGTLPREMSVLLASLGVTRLSYGIQTLDEELLSTMNRFYNIDEALEELKHAVEHIGNVNVDTMYGFDGEPPTALADSLKRFHELGVPSLSIYALDSQRSVKKDFFLGPPQDTLFFKKIDMFHEAELLLAELGYAPVLQNIFAQPERSSYTHQVRRWDNVPLLALGVGSMGYAPRVAYQNTGQLKTYFEMLDAGRLPITTTDRLSPQMELAREITSKLRFTAVDVDEIKAKYGVDLDVVFGGLIATLTESGYLEREGTILRMTKAASPYNNIIPMFFAPDDFKQELMGLPEEYIEKMPVPYILTQLGACQDASMEPTPQS